MDKTTNAPDSGSKLERVKAELAEMKQYFGIDKQEAFLEVHANISLKEFADMLNGRDCQPNLTPDELLLAQKRGFVVVYGDSDDRVEFDGAIRAEGHTNPMVKDSPAGVLALTDNGELLDEDSELYAEYVRENRNVIKVFYCNRDRLNWAFESDIPHETFIIYDGGYDEEYAVLNDGFARCMVFDVSALKRKPLVKTAIIIRNINLNTDIQGIREAHGSDEHWGSDQASVACWSKQITPALINEILAVGGSLGYKYLSLCVLSENVSCFESFDYEMSEEHDAFMERYL